DDIEPAALVRMETELRHYQAQRSADINRLNEPLKVSETGRQARLDIVNRLISLENATQHIINRLTSLENATQVRKFSIRLGLVQQYPPMELEVPASYYAEIPPSNAPRIAIVTPSLNHAAYLKQAIDSILEQEYPNLAYFVQDGGSKDGSVDIL